MSNKGKVKLATTSNESTYVSGKLDELKLVSYESTLECDDVIDFDYVSVEVHDQSSIFLATREEKKKKPSPIIWVN